MTTDCPLIARTPSDLIAIVPFVLGYHPANSVTVLGLTGQDVTFGACYELPPPDCDDGDAQELALTVAATVARQEIQSLVVVGFGPAARVTPAVSRLMVALRFSGVRLNDALRVTEGRWWSYLCKDLRCCPDDGTPCLPPDSVIAAEATFRGQVALPSRRDLVARVAPVEGEEREAMAAATERARKRFAELLADDLGAARYARRICRAGQIAVRQAESRYRSSRSLDPDELAWLGALLVDRAVEDYALDRIKPQEWRIRLWTDVLRRVEQVYVPAPACLLGFTAWRAGNGALARVAVDRALAVEPQHQLASLLHQVLGFGLSPHMVGSMARPDRARRERRAR
ncbi:hypothetical protein FB565_004470 [Actinoplanes lutulentus]|uniref:Uncharacterized protein DUF4192 n=1 Tax=Actinoplanes lutulentus TaxID=1287878 RepID=A0A327ZAQ3_9ACTN|nr:DUF4192 domain-containing protein [Actinoplanes lutulentus]MBB2944737.1 hypothetical protein [Actinoplanes lutulentus]RAK35468.1 uncharacterized protein DUF4192 [Actinoplanes lutulentus]